MRRSRIVFGVVLAVAVGSGCGSSSSPDAGGSPTGTATAPSSPESVSVLSSSVVLDAAHARLALRLRQPAGVDPPLARVATLDLPPGIRWRGGDAPACARATLVREGVAGCPREAIIGRGTACAAADTATTVGQITVVNGGAGRVLLATVVRHPAYVKAVVDGRVLSAPGGRSRLVLTFPDALQTVAGVPLGLERLSMTLDRGPWLQVGPCPLRAWRYAASVRLVDGATVTARGRVVCSG